LQRNKRTLLQSSLSLAKELLTASKALGLQLPSTLLKAGREGVAASSESSLFFFFFSALAVGQILSRYLLVLGELHHVFTNLRALDDPLVRRKVRIIGDPFQFFASFNFANATRTPS